MFFFNFCATVFLFLYLLGFAKSACTGSANNRQDGGSGTIWSIGYTGLMYEATYTVDSTVTTVAWKAILTPTSSVTIDFLPTECGTVRSDSSNLFSVTCSITGNSVTTSFTVVQPLSTTNTDGTITFEVYGSSQLCSGITRTITIEACPNISTTWVVQDVPANAAFGSTHNFTCSSNHVLSAGAALLTSTCQADATWSPIPVCNQACNTTTIPSSPSYKSPSTSELIFVGSSKDLTCTSGYIGSASAVCNAAGDTRSWTVTNGCKAVCSQPSADYCVHGTNTSVTTVTEGSDVNVGCCNGKNGSTTAVCATPGNITLSLDCSQACPNITTTWVVQDVPANAASGSTHNFTCSSNYALSTGAALLTSTCQADATWSPIPVCNQEDDPPVGAIVGGTLGGTVCLCVVGAAAYIFSVSIKVTPTPVGDKLSITIKWKAQSTPTVKYIVTWDPTGGSPEQPVFIDSSKGELTIDGLDPGQNYTITVKPEHRLVPGFLGSTRTCAPKSA